MADLTLSRTELSPGKMQILYCILLQIRYSTNILSRQFRSENLERVYLLTGKCLLKNGVDQLPVCTKPKVSADISSLGDILREQNQRRAEMILFADIRAVPPSSII